MSNNPQNTEIENSQDIQSQKTDLSATPVVKVASAKDFKEHFRKMQEGIIITLPHSKLNVKVQAPDMISMLLEGKFPKDLVSVALQLKGLAPKETLDRLDADKLIEMMQFINNFFMEVVIEPVFKVKPEPDEEAVDINLIDIADKMIVIELINRGVEALEMFRPKSDGEDSGSNSTEVREDTQPVIGDNGQERQS